jgi:hypothetical protein
MEMRIDELKNGEIEELASFIEGHICSKPMSRAMASLLYGEGYRHASDVAREIFELIDCAFSPVLVYNGYTIKEYLAELKKKYTFQ